METASCNVCIEPFNNSQKRQVVCNFCDYSTCRECAQHYILTCNEHAHCMNCKKEWTRKMLLTMFTKKFVNTDYKTHREQVLFEKQKALLPATQLAIEETRRVNAIVAVLKELRKELLRVSKTDTELFEHIKAQIEEKQQEMTEPKPQNPQQFVKSCPFPNCKGFLSSQWKCGICENWSCPTCHEPKGPSRDTPHTCNQETVETIKLLKTDSKPCPKCGINIFKINGCNQMWCTQCHTTFDWVTGQLETNIHNPHYFEWLRRNGGHIDRNPLDVMCGREVDHFFVNDLMTTHRSIDAKLLEFIRCVIHMRYSEIPRFAVNDRDTEWIRREYLQNYITEEQFKFRLQKQDKCDTKKREITNVINTAVLSGTDIAFRLLNELKQAYRVHQQHVTSQPVITTGDIVWLSAADANLNIGRPITEDDNGPYQVVQEVGPMSYRLNLSYRVPGQWSTWSTSHQSRKEMKGVNPVFHVSLLKPVLKSGKKLAFNGNLCVYTQQVYRMSPTKQLNDKLKGIEHNYKTEIEGLRVYINECLGDISDTYNCVHYNIDNNWNFGSGQ